MQKNVAGQVIGAQMVSATTGAAFTGTVTVSVTGDGGSQTTGSVGDGLCTHEGNGYHTYTPAQAETNYTLVAFTFTGTGAIPVTIQVFTSMGVNGFTATAKAEINYEVLDVFNVDTFSEPGQEAPAATNTLAKKIGYLFKFLRNKKTQTATETKLFADDGTTVDQKSTVSDDGSTFTSGKWGSGP